MELRVTRTATFDTGLFLFALRHSAQQPPQLSFNYSWQPFLGILQQQAMEVDLGVDLGLLIHQGEGEAHSVLDPVAAPDAGTEATVLVHDHEILFRPCAVVGSELADQALNLLAFQVAVGGDELPARSGVGLGDGQLVGAEAPHHASERGGLNLLACDPTAPICGLQILGSALVLLRIIKDSDGQRLTFDLVSGRLECVVGCGLIFVLHCIGQGLPTLKTELLQCLLSGLWKKYLFDLSKPSLQLFQVE